MESIKKKTEEYKKERSLLVGVIVLTQLYFICLFVL
jgi:hypothetical protein